MPKIARKYLETAEIAGRRKEQTRSISRIEVLSTVVFIEEAREAEPKFLLAIDSSAQK